jgi:hypothetical protein
MLSGCSTVGVTKLASAPSKPYDCEIQIVLSEKEAKRSFDTLCMLDARPGAEGKIDRSVAATLETMKKRACDCGADAMILMDGSDSEGVVKARAVCWKK